MRSDGVAVAVELGASSGKRAAASAASRPPGASTSDVRADGTVSTHSVVGRA